MWLKSFIVLPAAAWPSAPPCSMTKMSNLPAMSRSSRDMNFWRLRGFGTAVKATPAIRNRRSKHSSDWIKRHITDRYVQRAQEERNHQKGKRPCGLVAPISLWGLGVDVSSNGIHIKSRKCDYRSRSAFKLEQLDDEYLFLRKDKVILDLGCYPGGWCQVASKRCLVGQGPFGPETNLSKASSARVIGVDIAQMDPLPSVQFVQGRVGEATTLHAVLKELGDRKADVVLSDLAPACTGSRHDDHFNSVELCLYAADLMEQVLCLGGSFVVKMFMGSETGNFKAYLKSRFDIVHSAKPRACRQESREMYFVCMGFKGRDKISAEVQIKGSFSTREGYL